MRRDVGVVLQKYNFYVDQKIRNIRKLNIEQSEIMDKEHIIDPII